MEILKGFKKFRNFAGNSIIAIGNFDGVHLGHQKVLRFLSRTAKKESLYPLVLTFSPHPEKILGRKRTRMIQTLEQRAREVGKFGIKIVLVVPFNKKFRNLPSRDFVEKVVVKTLGVKAVVVGRDFRFGKNRKGNVSLLRRLASRYKYRVYSVPPVKKSGKTVSSSLIRILLERGEVEKAKTFLGRTYEIEGDVVKGKSRGKILGFPTANIETRNEIVPDGIYITTTRVGREAFPSLTNVGSRPTFGEKETSVESYIIDFNRNLYGKKIRINFIKKLRDERKFKAEDDLARQIQKDLKATRKYFRLN